MALEALTKKSPRRGDADEAEIRLRKMFTGRQGSQGMLHKVESTSHGAWDQGQRESLSGYRLF